MECFAVYLYLHLLNTAMNDRPGDACWSTVYRCVNKGLQNLWDNPKQCVRHFEIDTLFTVSSQKVTLSNVVNLNASFLTSATFCKTIFLQK